MLCISFGSVALQEALSRILGLDWNYHPVHSICALPNSSRSRMDPGFMSTMNTMKQVLKVKLWQSLLFRITGPQAVAVTIIGRT
jgi:hypothetical protein